MITSVISHLGMYDIFSAISITKNLFQSFKVYFLIAFVKEDNFCRKQNVIHC